MIDPERPHDREHVLSLLDAYMDGELGSSERARVTEHLDLCADCRAEHAALVQLDRELRSELKPSTAVTVQVARRPVRRPRGGPVALIASGLAAGFLLALMWVPAFVTPHGPSEPPRVTAVIGDCSWLLASTKDSRPRLRAGEVIPSRGELVTESEGRIELRMAVGVRLRMSGGSCLRWKGDALILERGEIWLAVDEIGGRVQRVVSAGGSLTCRSGEFSWWTQGELSQLIVYRGAVEYRSSAQGVVHTVASGQRLLTSGTEDREPEDFFFAEKHLAWTYALLCLDESDPQERRAAIHTLLNGLDSTEAGLSRERLLVDPFGVLAVPQTVAFLSAGPWHATPDARRQAARVLEQIVTDRLPTPLVEKLFALIVDEDPIVSLALYLPVTRATGTQVVDRELWASFADPEHRKDVIEKWRAVWISTRPQ